MVNFSYFYCHFYLIGYAERCLGLEIMMRFLRVTFCVVSMIDRLYHLKKGMGVWMIFISLFNTEVFLGVTMMLRHNKIKLRNCIFPSIGFIMETCETHLIFERYVVMKMSNFLQKRPHPCILLPLSWYLRYLKYITYVCCPCHNRRLYQGFQERHHICIQQTKQMICSQFINFEF